MHAVLPDTALFVDIDGAQLRLDPAGLVAAPTIVVVHGGPGLDQGYLRPGIGALRDLAQLVFVDLRSQGRSRMVAVETCTLERMADDVVELCTYLGLDRPILLGHSAGGFVALHAALRAPAVFAGLILCNTAATLAPSPEADGPTLMERAGPRAAEVAARFFRGDIDPETEAAFIELVAPSYAGPAHEDIPWQLFVLSPPNIDLMRWFFGPDGPAARYDVRPRLGEITVPTLVIAGAHDWVCPPHASRTITAGIPGAELVLLADAGHFCFSEEPASFHAAVTAFMLGLSRGAR